MKVLRRTGDRMELHGIPQGRSLPFGILVCVGILIVASIFAYIEWSRNGSLLSAAGPLLGVGLMLFMIGALTLASFKRERLVIDRVTRTIEHETWSLLWGSRTSVVYPMDRVHAVAVQRTLEPAGGGRGVPIRVTRARVLIERPRRAIDLDEVRDGDEATIEALAREIAEFIGVSHRALGSHDDEASAPRSRRKKADDVSPPS